MKCSFLVAVMLVVLAACAVEGPSVGTDTRGWPDKLKLGSSAYDRGDYAAAVREWRPLAEQGDTEAQYRLGSMYQRGQGVPQDHAEAAKWWRKAAEQGHVRAQYNVGLRNFWGDDGPPDYAEAAKWWCEAAEQGHVQAQYNLGEMYRKGQGVPHDDAEAKKWYRRAAEQGFAKAQYNVGTMYRGVPLDLVQSYMWYSLAAAQGIEHAQGSRDLVAGVMTPAQLAEAERLTREWKPKEVAQRHGGNSVARDGRRSLVDTGRDIWRQAGDPLDSAGAPGGRSYANVKIRLIGHTALANEEFAQAAVRNALDALTNAGVPEAALILAGVIGTLAPEHFGSGAHPVDYEVWVIIAECDRNRTLPWWRTSRVYFKADASGIIYEMNDKADCVAKAKATDATAN
jgi:hypothetical protein